MVDARHLSASQQLAANQVHAENRAVVSPRHQWSLRFLELRPEPTAWTLRRALVEVMWWRLLLTSCSAQHQLEDVPRALGWQQGTIVQRTQPRTHFKDPKRRSGCATRIPSRVFRCSAEPVALFFHDLQGGPGAEDNLLAAEEQLLQVCLLLARRLGSLLVAVPMVLPWDQCVPHCEETRRAHPPTRDVVLWSLSRPIEKPLLERGRLDCCK